MRTLPFAALALILIAATPPRPTEAAKRGLALAEQRCAVCHGVAANSSSPNPESPTFGDIANRPGVTAATMRRFLRDSHSFPAAMDFTIDRAQVRDLAAYMMTLRQKRYRPTI